MIPIGSVVVPFWDYLLDPKYESQKGTTMEPIGRLLANFNTGV